MRKGLVFALVALPLAFALTLLALDAPTIDSANSDGTTIYLDWSDVEGATKYSVSVIAFYGEDGDGDGFPDQSADYDFGTSDRTDGGLMGDSNLQILIADMAYDYNEDGAPDLPGVVVLRVKALNPGKGAGRQNNLFSIPWTLDLR